MKNLSLFSVALLGFFSISSCSDKQLDAPDNAINTSGREMNNAQVMDTNIPDVNSVYQEKAVEYYQKIQNAFSSTPGRENNGFNDYPGYYGGAYINDQGKLVVLIKGNATKEKKQIANILGTEDFLTMPCKYSYKSLKRIMKELNEFKLNKANDAKSANFKAYGLRDNLNQIIVQLDEYNDIKIAEFKKDVMNTPEIVFVKSAGPLVELATLKPGCPAQGTGFSASFSFRARRNSDGKEGMVSSGHLFSTGDPLYENGVVIGYCSISQNSGSVDAAFIPITDAVTYFPSQLLCNSADVLSNPTSRPGVGTIVNMRGQTTGHSSGRILDTDASVTNPNGTVMTNLTTADFPAAAGDSGGIVYTVVSSTNTRPTVGIVKGKVGTTAYFTKADLALTALGVSRY